MKQYRIFNSDGYYLGSIYADSWEHGNHPSVPSGTMISTEEFRREGRLVASLYNVRVEEVNL